MTAIVYSAADTALISNLMARKLHESATLPEIMIAHYCLTVVFNAREARNARLSAGQVTKTMGF